MGHYLTASTPFLRLASGLGLLSPGVLGFVGFGASEAPESASYSP